jgi:hypothetical protein
VTQITPFHFSEWAKEASTGFLEDEVPMNDTIRGIAEEHSLTPMQIGQVCQQANVMTYERLFKTAEDKKFSFPLADSSKIVVAIKEEPTPEQVEAASPMDFLLEPPQQKVAHDWKAILGVKQISNEPEIARQLAWNEQALENIKAAQTEIRDMQMVNEIKLAELRGAFQAMVRQSVMEAEVTPLDALTKVAQACSLAFGDSIKRKLAVAEVVKVASSLVESGMLGRKVQLQMQKLAEAVQQDLISTKMDSGSAPEDKVTVVNGNHPIIMSVNQLVDQVSEEDRLKEGLHMLEDKASYAVKRIQDLNTSRLTDEYVQQETVAEPEVVQNPDPWKRRMREGVRP